MQCPKCNLDRAHRAHRRGLQEHAASLFGFFPYRCHECEHRFFHSYRTPDDPANDEPSSSVRDVRATGRHHAKRQKRRELLLFGLALLVFLAFLYYITRYHGAPAG